MWGLGLCVCLYLQIYLCKKRVYVCRRSSFLDFSCGFMAIEKNFIVKLARRKQQQQDSTLTPPKQKWITKHHLWFAGNVHVDSKKKRGPIGGTLLNACRRTHKTLKSLVHHPTGGLAGVQAMIYHKKQPGIFRRIFHLPRVCTIFWNQEKSILK